MQHVGRALLPVGWQSTRQREPDSINPGANGGGFLPRRSSLRLPAANWLAPPANRCETATAGRYWTGALEPW